MRISISKVVNSQLPSFVREEYPLFSEFLKQYYISDDSERLIQNLDKNIDLDVLFKVESQTKTTSQVNFIDKTISVESTYGFPDEYGLIKIDNEIILYESKTETQFLNCARGFSGVSEIDKEFLVFEESEFDFHNSGSIVYNLSSLFLQIFAVSIKKRISPGFEDRDLFVDLNKSNFLKNIKSFYTSKGSDESFRILFGALYGKEVEVIKPRDFLIRSSDAQYRFTKDISVEVISGDPYQLLNSTVYQDATETLEPAQGTVAEVNKIIRNNKEYFIISLDFDYNRDSDVSGTTKSEFTIHPKTITTSKILANSTYIDVDTTIGFPDKGSLQISLNDGNTLTVTYNDKVLNQFLDCSGIISDIPINTQINTFDYIYGFDSDGNEIRMRVNGVLGDVDFLTKTNYYKKDDVINIETLGENSKLFKANNWFFNISVRYEVENISIKDISDLSYRVFTIDDHNFVIGDFFTLFSSDGLSYVGQVIFVESENSIIIRGQGSLNTNLKYDIQKNISKVNVSNENYSYLIQYNSNIQNIYLDYSNNVYVSSPSLPNYYGYALDIKDNILKIPAGNYIDTYEITFSEPHKKYTGDAVVYKPINDQNKIVDFGVYYVKKINDRTIKLARSLYNIQNNSFVNFNGTILVGFESVLEPLDINDVNLNKLNIKPQRILKQINEPEPPLDDQETEVGPVAILVNGVEIYNYKSQDVVFYGGIENIDILSGGSGYNVINPPKIEIIDPVGIGASAFSAVEGHLERIDIIDEGFDYIENPTITITGGGGVGASAEPELIEFTHIVEFNSSTLVDLVNDTIETFDDHRFRNYEEIIYRTNNQKNISGISTNSVYYVEIVDQKKVKLHFTESDAVSGINTVNFTSVGVGVHQLVSTQPKKKLSRIKINNPGSGYKNKKVRISGINTASNEITVLNHNYSNGEIVSYYPENVIISGLSSSSSYYITVVDNNTLKLSGISTVGALDSNYQRKNYIKILSPELVGNHFLNYPEVNVSISGRIGVSTFSGQDFSGKLQPVFSGKIFNVFLDNPGSQYGSMDIINFQRTPLVEINSGKNAQITPVITGGTISKVIINSSGYGYQQVPELIVTPSQPGIELTPILENEKLIDVKIINGGKNLDPQNTKIEVRVKEKGAKFEAKIQNRRINIVEKLIKTNSISKDDGYIVKSSDSLQYTHLYSPRSLRESILRKIGNVNVKDLNFKFNKEQISTIHSPLLGWAYDGNPIYGPYGYKNGNSGSISALKSGYELKTVEELTAEGRPSFDIYPIGFFIDDYKFTGNGDLDEHNGRYCLTPEFPNGVYAYFCTISNIISDSSSPFFNYYAPVFPYVIGNTFRNKFNKTSHTLESLGNKILRNTTPYNLTKNNSSYDYILAKPKENIKIEKTKNSKIDSYKILNPGDKYKINDKIVFTDGGYAKVKEVFGTSVTNVGVYHTAIYGVEISSYEDKLVGISSVPHGINSVENYIFNSPYEINKNIKVTPISNSIVLATQVEPSSVTGIITYFNVNLNLQFPLKENDIFTINSEKVKILNIQPELSRIRVQREYEGTSGINTHNVNSVLIDNSRKFILDLELSISYNLIRNNEFYFDPFESVGIGTLGNYTLNISNPGVGKTTLIIPVKTIYIKNHQLSSGDSIFYNTNGGTSIQASVDGITQVSLDTFPELFVTKVDNDVIGISTQKSGVGIQSSSLYFINPGSGKIHSFKTNYENTLIGDISKNVVTVSTGNSHGLSLTDNVTTKIISKTPRQYNVYYDDHNRKICFDKKYLTSVDLINNIIYSPNHEFKSGDKVIYVSSSSIGGIQSKFEYYIVYVNKDSFKLSETYYNCLVKSPITINLTSSGTGYFYKVNPKIEIIKDQDIIFDTTDSSLSFNYAGSRYPAFELKLYTNKEFTDEYYTYDLEKTGVVGVTSSNYQLSTKNIPDKIYYKFVPTNLDISPIEKAQIYFDQYSINSGAIEKIESKYSGSHVISGISSNTFSYSILNYPEKNSYNINEADISYTSNSRTISGPISNIELISLKLSNEIPTVKNIISNSGSNAVIKLESSNIGEIEKIKKFDIGFNYSKDYTIRPKLSLPKIIELEPSYKLEAVGVNTRGYGYSYPPTLVVVNNLNNTVYNNIKFNFDLNLNKITIVENKDILNTKDVKIIPTDNDNGFQIDTITFNDISKQVTVKLRTGFNTITEYPFNVGESVLVEGVPKVSPTLLGYNSKEYNYRLFKIVSSTPNIGGTGATFAYSLDGLIPSGQTLSQVDSTYTSGTVVPEKYIPSFNLEIKNTEFIKNENVKINNVIIGKVSGWNSNNNQIKISTLVDINSGDVIYGETSKNYSTVSGSYSPNAFISVNSNSYVSRGWKTNVGFLNDSLQRIHDSNYYQYFSYELKSEIDYSNWSDAVDTLNHTSGFKKFGNLLINTSHQNTGINTDQNFGDLNIINELYSELDVNSFSDFDLVTENYFTLNDGLKSNEVYFKSRRLQNYIESVNNKVILIDDISDKFKPVDVEESTTVDTFNKNSYRFKKYILHVLDKLNPSNSQGSVLNLLHNDNIVGISQYAIVNTGSEIGYFDAQVVNFDIKLNFSPIIKSSKIYSINSFSYNISESSPGIGSVVLGNTSSLVSYSVTGIGKTIISSIPQTRSASKVLILYTDPVNNLFYSDEINYVHDGTNIIYNLYNEINLGEPSGIGTYRLFYENSNVNIELDPNSSSNYKVDSFTIQISDSSSSSTDLILLSGNKIESTVVSVTASGSPQKTLIYSYNNIYSSGLHQIVIEDLDNNFISYYELFSLLNSSVQQVNGTDFGYLHNYAEFGIIEIEYSLLGELEIYFTPFNDINYQVRMVSSLTSKYRRSETLEI